MTDRQRFEDKAIECGAVILESTRTFLEVLATNGLMITDYTFNEDGQLVDCKHFMELG